MEFKYATKLNKKSNTLLDSKIDIDKIKTDKEYQYYCIEYIDWTAFKYIPKEYFTPRLQDFLKTIFEINLYKNPYNIIYLQYAILPEETIIKLCKETIKRKPEIIEYIINPSVELCLEAMYIKPIVFYKIDRNHQEHNKLKEMYRYMRI